MLEALIAMRVANVEVMFGLLPVTQHPALARYTGVIVWVMWWLYAAVAIYGRMNGNIRDRVVWIYVGRYETSVQTLSAVITRGDGVRGASERAKQRDVCAPNKKGLSVFQMARSLWPWL